jgi:predicted RNA-binding protein associated with RNAse of E/G family
MGGMAALHPPKVEIFDPAARANIDPKGILRAVEEFREEPFGLYLARPTPGRAQFHYLESWLLPGLGLRLTDFWFTPGHERDQDFYLDVVRVRRDGPRWVATDLYVDLVLKDKLSLRVIDTDELLAAVAAGLLSAEDAEDALKTTYAAVEGLAAHGYDLAAWLSTKDISLTWRRHP